MFEMWEGDNRPHIVVIAIVTIVIAVLVYIYIYIYICGLHRAQIWEWNGREHGQDVVRLRQKKDLSCRALLPQLGRITWHLYTGLISGLIGNPTNSPCGIVLHPQCNLLYKWRGAFHAPMKSKRVCKLLRSRRVEV